MKPIRFTLFSLLFSIFCLPMHAFSGEWSSMTSGTTNNLNAVWGSSGSDVFAVGNGGTILRYDGSSWTSMTSGTTNNLNAVWGSSGSDVFAVGNSGTILRYDGSSWTSMTSGTTYNLYGLWGSSSNDVYTIQRFSWFSRILRFDGTTWNSWGNPTPGYYGCLWGSSGTDLYLGGAFMTFNPYGDTTYIMDIIYYDGTKFLDVDIPVYLKSNVLKYYFTGIWGVLTSTMFAVGTNGIILCYDGSTWTSMTSGTTNKLNGVWGASAKDVFAVGDGGTILHYAEETLIALESFTAVSNPNKVLIRWSTASELDNAGFNLYRADSEEGPYTKINVALIPAKGSATQGAEYEFVDMDVRLWKTYYYKLEDIDVNGISVFHGPASAMLRLINW